MMDYGPRLLRGMSITNLGFIVMTVLFVVVAHAQAPESPEEVSDLGLPTLSGEVTVYYSEGYKERAASLQEVVEAANRFLKKPEVLGIELNLGLAVLDAEDWSRWTRMPYGMAHIQLGESPAAIMPATEDNMLVNGALENKEHVSKEILLRLDELEFSYEDAAVLMFMDLLGIHEVGHIYSEAYETWPTEKWLSEFIATYLAYAFFKDSRPAFAQLWDTMMDSMVETNEHGHSSLADFEELYVRVGGSNYGWYQARFTQKVREVHAKFGISFIHALKQSLAENPEAAEGDPFRLRELDAFSEGFMEWAKGPDGDLK
ncbi:hypothetical protein ACFL0G_02215 [Candidatus Zixiibacteriota bacterium]